MIKNFISRVFGGGAKQAAQMAHFIVSRAQRDSVLQAMSDVFSEMPPFNVAHSRDMRVSHG